MSEKEEARRFAERLLDALRAQRGVERAAMDRVALGPASYVDVTLDGGSRFEVRVSPLPTED